MISFDTTRFGRLEVAKDKIMHFPNGLIGFPETKRFVLMDYKDTLLKWIQAVDDKDVAFIVVPAVEFFPDFTVRIDNVTKDLLEIGNEEDVIVFSILRVENEQVTANLQGPLVINSINKKGIQIVNEDTRFSCQTPMKALDTAEAG